MKLNDEVLLEIVDIVRIGLVEGKDVSDLLRDLDLDVEKGVAEAASIIGSQDHLTLSQGYKARKGRVT